MWRRHSIAARKASWDAKKSRIYAKIGKIIQIAAKWWADASMNPALELALQKARYHGLPRDVIDKAILKWSWQLEGEDLQEVIFEGYGPGWSAILIKTLTENTNRTSSNIKVILGKLGGSLGKPGSVAWQFTETGVFVIDGKVEKKLEKWNMVENTLPLDAEEAELELMELPVKDIESDKQWITVYTSKSDFTNIQNILILKNYHVVEWALHFLADDTINLDENNITKLSELVKQLEEDDDVDEVYHNGG